MVLESTDILAIIIALSGACLVMILSIRDNRALRIYIKELEEKNAKLKKLLEPPKTKTKGTK
jgi:hypothetical protein